MTMYDMSRVNANGYFDAMDEDARYAARQALNALSVSWITAAEAMSLAAV